MKILIWNVEFWKNFSKDGWLIKCLDMLNKLITENNIEIILLQEINPFKLISIAYEITEPKKKKKILSENKLMLYHELFSEIPKRYRKSPWGNVIIINRKYNEFNNLLDITTERNYYGRNGLMCYSFDFHDIGKISFINFYNKSNNRKYTMLSDSYFEIKDDLDRISERVNGLILFAGDFNTGSNNSDFEHEKRYNILCDKLNGFTDISNGDPEFNLNTTYWYNCKSRKGIFLRNDFCFINNQQYIENYIVKIPRETEWEGDEKNKRWKGISDHCPVIMELTLR
jgi:exonuclease III